MNSVFVSFPITDFPKTKLQVLNWASRFSVCCLLDSNGYELPEHAYRLLLGAGIKKSIEAPAGNAFNALKDFSTDNKEWLFGHFAFDLKAETELIPSQRPDHVLFPDLFFFIPETVIELDAETIRIGSDRADHEIILRQIQEMPASPEEEPRRSGIIRERFSRADYIASVEAIRQHILRGDCYELNFCIEFFAEDAFIDPTAVYHLLSQASPTPFAGFYKLHDKYLLCASPERYLSKRGERLLSQPMKGTWPRNGSNGSFDDAGREKLFLSAKDRSENVMVVDLVRNDLSKICEEGSVQVDELYGVYSFPLVHQMVSTVSGKINPGLHWAEAVRATFPMGSMTGAPKRRVLELIERYEKTRRGLFSGAIGYVSPEGDFDFNVVIRSILYNQHNRYLSYQAGSGITFHSNAEKEYEECLLKAAAIKKVLAG